MRFVSCRLACALLVPLAGCAGATQQREDVPAPASVVLRTASQVLQNFAIPIGGADEGLSGGVIQSLSFDPLRIWGPSEVLTRVTCRAPIQEHLSEGAVWLAVRVTVSDWDAGAPGRRPAPLPGRRNSVVRLESRGQLVDPPHGECTLSANFGDELVKAIAGRFGPGTREGPIASPRE